MGRDRRRILQSYLALAVFIVGALLYALPSTASSPWRARAGSVIDLASAGDLGILSGPTLPRELLDQRSARASLDNGADTDALPSSGGCRIQPVGGQSFFLFDSSRCGASRPRLAHRPRDPPQSA